MVFIMGLRWFLKKRKTTQDPGIPMMSETFVVLFFCLICGLTLFSGFYLNFGALIMQGRRSVNKKLPYYPLSDKYFYSHGKYFGMGRLPVNFLLGP